MLLAGGIAMEELVRALHAECSALDNLLETFSPDRWERHTDFFHWTVADEIMHLHLVDKFALQTVQDPELFAASVSEVRAAQALGLELSAQMRTSFGHLPPEDLLASWRRTWIELCRCLKEDTPKRRVKWFGPDMSIRSLTAARQMEVWAHGQDIFDLFSIRRRSTDRIYNICDLGVRTFGWSFQNRGDHPPAQPPRVRLRSPSGLNWSWNDASPQTVEGTAEEFALVVTQRRNVADTTLRVQGADAKRWMSIAQCFAGPPETPPAPGERVLRRH
jgi:uncharacterized protein (TIGR03084 family)